MPLDETAKANQFQWNCRQCDHAILCRATRRRAMLVTCPQCGHKNTIPESRVAGAYDRWQSARHHRKMERHHKHKRDVRDMKQRHAVEIDRKTRPSKPVPWAGLVIITVCMGGFVYALIWIINHHLGYTVSLGLAWTLTVAAAAVVPVLYFLNRTGQGVRSAVGVVQRPRKNPGADSPLKKKPPPA